MVASCYLDGPPYTELWFDASFLAAGIVVAPGCTWLVRGRKVVQEYRDGRTRVWMLTDRCNLRGQRLGVWPD
jgi:hypothetical protein